MNEVDHESYIIFSNKRTTQMVAHLEQSLCMTQGSKQRHEKHTLLALHNLIGTVQCNDTALNELLLTYLLILESARHAQKHYNVFFKRLPPYTSEAFDLTTLNFAGGDDST
jgi:hypothetical protein